jgi:hypothetical protein
MAQVIRKCSDRTPVHGDDLGRPVEVGVSHGNRSAALAAPRIGLKVREVTMHRDVTSLTTNNDVCWRFSATRQERWPAGALGGGRQIVSLRPAIVKG